MVYFELCCRSPPQALMLSNLSPERLVDLFHRLLQSLLTCLIIKPVFNDLNLPAPIHIFQCFLPTELVGIEVPLQLNLCDNFLDLGGLSWRANSVTRHKVVVFRVATVILLLDLLLRLLVLNLWNSGHLLKVGRLSCHLARWGLSLKLLAHLNRILSQTSLSFLKLIFPGLSELFWALIYEARPLVGVWVWRRYGFTQRLKLHFHLLMF